MIPDAAMSDPVEAAPAAPPIRLLLVEDDRFLRKAAEVMLRKHGFEVLTAQDGEAGLAVAREQGPTLILLDLIMPRMQGFQVIEHLKADPATAGIPVIVMSNLGQESDVQRAMEAGAAAYVVKSNVALHDLADRVRSVLSGRR
jgi:DNA-binding response OmpR family regulator